jgi:hypothetical protein
MLPTDTCPQELAPIRAQLARAFLEHKADLGVPLADDAKIVNRVDEITALLFDSAGRALRTNNQRWLERYEWFAKLVDNLMSDAPRQPLDGCRSFDPRAWCRPDFLRCPFGQHLPHAETATGERDAPPDLQPAPDGGRRGRGGGQRRPVVRHSFRHPRPEGCVHVRASARVHAGNGRILRSGRSSRGEIDLNIGQVVDVPNTTLSAVLPLDILDRRSASSRPGLEIFRH